MLVVTLPATPADPQNCVVVDGTPYVVAWTGAGSFVMPARCPHRGGPMHLGELEPERGTLVCPMHGRRTSVTRCIRRGIPAVRRGDRVTAVFPQPSTPVRTRHLPLSADLSRAPAGAA